MFAGFLLFPPSDLQLFSSSVFVPSSRDHNSLRLVFFDFSCFSLRAFIVDYALNDLLNIFILWMIRVTTFWRNYRWDFSLSVNFGLFLWVGLPLVINPIIENGLLCNSIIVLLFGKRLSFGFESIWIERRSHFLWIILNSEWLLKFEAYLFVVQDGFLL